ncbi:MAG: hypothetical protein J0I86_10940, partial [Mesorhizobium sp.]|nr:hypothetical protein [Mesorhizobium sp.]
IELMFQVAIVKAMRHVPIGRTAGDRWPPLNFSRPCEGIGRQSASSHGQRQGEPWLSARLAAISTAWGETTSDSGAS